MKIATWNVNSIKVRLPHVLRYLDEAGPDVLLLQELKAVEDAFPWTEILAQGYRAVVFGQKTYNGVAILSRFSIEESGRGLDSDTGGGQARYIEAMIDGRLIVASLYAPNGNPVDSDKYPYKLRWLESLRNRAEELLALHQPVILGGDYNICPTDDDVFDPVGWAEDALCRPESRERYRALLNLGFTDVYRALHKGSRRYSFWDYKGRAWDKNHGARIDHLLASPQAVDMLTACDIDQSPRSWERASDHTAVWCSVVDP